ncbi:MAG: hypothetical protein HC934_04325 [Acaryochloridaceae cyanobacterium SU_2_1]|nr:hypothetical protein [Acaryochloridaceae cyanobacterium SU_2_1]
MTPEAMRQFWSLIEATQTHILLTLDNDALVTWLTGKLNHQDLLRRMDPMDLRTYINTRLPLIRAIAEERHSLYQSGASCGAAG